MTGRTNFTCTMSMDLKTKFTCLIIHRGTVGDAKSCNNLLKNHSNKLLEIKKIKDLAKISSNQIVM
jgi:hypothetical protein